MNKDVFKKGQESPSKEPRAADAQQKYLQILFDDNRFTSVQKKFYLVDNYSVTFLDELTIAQASKLIDILKQMKEKET